MEEPSESQWSVSEVCLCAIICLVVGVIAVDIYRITLKTETGPAVINLLVCYLSYTLILCMKGSYSKTKRSA